MPQKQKLSLEEKVEIIQEYLKGTISKSEAARRGGVVRDTNRSVGTQLRSRRDKRISITQKPCVQPRTEDAGREGLPVRERESVRYLQKISYSETNPAPKVD